MKEITNKGNMPDHLAIFARQLGGTQLGNMDTKFYEALSVDEFEKEASEIGYEIVPTMDASTNRCYLVGFAVEEPTKIQTIRSYAQLKMYFIELSSSEFNQWNKKIKEHRDMQQEDYFIRDRKIKKAREYRKYDTTKKTNNNR